MKYGLIVVVHNWLNNDVWGLCLIQLNIWTSDQWQKWQAYWIVDESKLQTLLCEKSKPGFKNTLTNWNNDLKNHNKYVSHLDSENQMSGY